MRCTKRGACVFVERGGLIALAGGRGAEGSKEFGQGRLGRRREVGVRGVVRVMG